MTARRRTFTAGLIAIFLALVCPVARAELPGWAIDPVAPGIDHLRHERGKSLSVHAARVRAGAASLRVVVAGNAVGGLPGNPYAGREYTSDLCRRGGGLLCVNGDFFSCSSCGQSAGGIVIDGRPLRSFRPDLSQLSIVDGAVTTAPLGWSGRMAGRFGGERFEVALDSLNRDPIHDGLALYTADWGPRTPPNVPRVELVFAAGGSLTAGSRTIVPVARRDVAGPIPADAVVVLGTGASAGVLDGLWHRWTTTRASERTLQLHTALTSPASLSIGGHPALLRHGERQPLNHLDPFVTRRHPRTLAGATADGDLLLVAVDGRQPGHSEGLTLYEAADLMVELGAVEAINLDGGGSTTFIGRCGNDACVRNRPSGGSQRPVVSALAIVPVRPSARPAPKPDVVKAAAVDPSAPPAPAPAVEVVSAPPAAPAPAPPPVTAVVDDASVIAPVAPARPAPVALAPVADVVALDVPTPSSPATPDRTAISLAAAASALAAAGAALRVSRRGPGTRAA